MIPDKYKPWFPFQEFNRVQSQCLQPIMHSDQNVLISAPTGSGKTTLFEFAMIRAFEMRQAPKVLYIAPVRALCSEKYDLWSKKLSNVGKTCVELIGGDGSNLNISADLIISTPEKCEFISRNKSIIESIGLILIDEVHFLNDPRGSVLEAVVSRMRLINENVRIIAVSATVPNTEDLGRWLGSSTAAKILKFPDSMRPVPLKTHVLSAPMGDKNAFKFDFSLNYKLSELISKYSDGKATLIFCSTRKSAIKTATFLSNNPISTEDTVDIHFEDKGLQESIVKYRIGYHHAGLSTNDREAVENLFREGKIKILCCTSTLAIGVNLPARLVIVKSTLQYNETGYCEYSDLDVRQMIGRAGRPGHDSHGTAVILTSTQTEHLYRSISDGKLEIESNFLPSFIDYLNIEIANGNINSFSDAMKWLKYSYLYIMILKNPEKYSINPSGDLDKQISKSMEMFVNELKVNDVIFFNGSEISPTSIGKALANNFIRFKSFKELSKNSLLDCKEISDLLKILCHNSEVCHQNDMKGGDKMLLQKIASNSQLLFPLAENKIGWDAWKRPFYLIQVALQSELVEFESKLTPNQRTDQDKFIETCIRLLKFVIEYASLKQKAILLRNSMEFLSSLQGKAWHSNSKLLQQIPGIGQASSIRLFNAGIKSINNLMSIEASRLEVILKRNPPFGRNLIEQVKNNFPRIEFTCEMTEGHLSIYAKAHCESVKLNGIECAHVLVIAYESTDSGLIVFHEKIRIIQSEFKKKIDIGAFEQKSFSCSLMFEKWSGLNQNFCFYSKSDKQLTPPETAKDAVTNTIEQVPKKIKENDFSPSPVSVKTTPVKQSGCKHNCKDKFLCAHVCCKEGLLKRGSQSLTPISPSKRVKNNSNNFLAGSHRSLANARAYLQKYRPINIFPKLAETKNDQNLELFEEIEFELR